MSSVHTIESAAQRIEAYRAKHGITPLSPVEAQGTLAIGLPPLERMGACNDCPEVGTWAPFAIDGPLVCPRCADKRRLAEMRNLDVSVIFADGAISREYWTFDEEWLTRNEGGWPKDHRRRLQHDLERWHGDPRFVTLSGTSGNGKTTLAVELARRCYRAWGHRYGAKSIFLVRPRHLFEEQFSDEKPRTTWALRSPITILDDAFADGQDTANKIDVVQDFLSARWERTRSATIVTTNRSISKAVDGAPLPIEQIARPVFDRMTDGLLIWLKGPSFRGRK